MEEGNAPDPGRVIGETGDLRAALGVPKKDRGIDESCRCQHAVVRREREGRDKGVSMRQRNEGPQRIRVADPNLSRFVSDRQLLPVTTIRQRSDGIAYCVLRNELSSSRGVPE